MNLTGAQMIGVMQFGEVQFAGATEVIEVRPGYGGGW